VLLCLLFLRSQSAGAAVATPVKFNFQPAGAALPSGYTKDSGAAYSDTAGFGWVTQASLSSGTHVPLSLTPNTRDRNLVSDQRYDTFIHMQFPTASGTNVTTPGAWECSVANGSYTVTVAVGDAGNFFDSSHRINVEGTTAIPNFVPTSATHFATATVTVTVSDGRLTLNAIGGTNTKLDFVDIAPAPTDTTPPAAPTGVTATGGDGQVSLNWNANTEPDLAGYNVFRGTSLPVSTSGTPLNGGTKLTGTTYLDTGLVNGTTYYYVVQALDQSGNKADSSALSAMPTGGGGGFQDLASAVGIARTLNTHGENCVFDYDNDGVKDVLLSTHGSGPWQLMRGNQDGTFTETNVGVFADNDRHSCSVADFVSFNSDGSLGGPDGLLDVYTTIGACQGTCTKAYPNELYIQRSGGIFAKAANAGGAADEHGRGRDSIAFNLDNDGRIDLFVGNEQSELFNSSNRIYRNNGAGFTEFTNSIVTQEVGNRCVTKGDYNGDGWEDLLVCTTTVMKLYRNNGGTSFSDVSSSAGISTTSARDAELVDINKDGKLDLVFVNQKTLGVRLGNNSRFASTNYSRSLNEGSDLAVADADGDGDNDIYVAQELNSTYPDYLLLNSGSSKAYTSAAIPQATIGSGDTVVALINYRNTGRAAFIVNNGKWETSGPRQFIYMVIQ
jgi:hypothetical protein